MSANSKPKTLTNNQWIRDAAELLADAGITSARLDAEIILAHTIRRSRTWIHAHSDELLDERTLDIAGARLDLRLDRVPIAYIIGHKEFYGRLLKVSPSVLVPRPESEFAIELLRQYLPPSAHTLLDVGTGSGCIGITAKLELPNLAVTLSDVGPHALTIAHENAEALRADVAIIKSDLLESVDGIFDCIVANLPYVDKSWQRSPETDHEPELALFADERGLALIYRLIDQAPLVTTPQGMLLLEADPEQHAEIISYAGGHGFPHCLSSDYYVIASKGELQSATTK